MLDQMAASSLTKDFDLFVATPMSAYEGAAYKANRDIIIRSVSGLRREAGDISIFCPALKISDVNKWDLTHSALEEDLLALESSELFVMTYTRPAPARISSVIVEAGVALALRIPSIYIVNSRSDLPYLLREADLFAESERRRRSDSGRLLNEFCVEIIECPEGTDFSEALVNTVSARLRTLRAS